MLRQAKSKRRQGRGAERPSRGRSHAVELPEMKPKLKSKQRMKEHLERTHAYGKQRRKERHRRRGCQTEAYMNIDLT